MLVFAVAVPNAGVFCLFLLVFAGLAHKTPVPGSSCFPDRGFVSIDIQIPKHFQKFPKGLSLDSLIV